MSGFPIRRHAVYKDIRKTLDDLSRMSPVGKITSQLLEGLIESWLEYYPQYDDLRSPATGIRPLGSASDPDIDPDDGTFLFDSTLVEVIGIINLIPHTWKFDTIVYPHVHWMKTTDAAGDVIWEYTYRIIDLHDTAPAWSAWIPASTRSLEPGSTQKSIIDGFGELEMGDVSLASIVSVKVRRNVDALGDDYGADAKLLEFDMHMLKDSQGSNLPFVKDEAGI